MAEPTDSPPGLLASLKRLGRTLLAIAQNRLELLLVELQEERRRAIKALLLLLAVGVLGLMTLVVGTFTLVVIFWENRVIVLSGLTLAYLLAVAGAYWKLCRLLHDWSAFAATLAELKKDRAWIEERK
jgi:uncharacterized membrane protein YqjE